MLVCIFYLLPQNFEKPKNQTLTLESTLQLACFAGVLQVFCVKTTFFFFWRPFKKPNPNPREHPAIRAFCSLRFCARKLTYCGGVCSSPSLIGGGWAKGRKKRQQGKNLRDVVSCARLEVVCEVGGRLRGWRSLIIGFLR